MHTALFPLRTAPGRSGLLHLTEDLEPPALLERLDLLHERALLVEGQLG